MSFQDHDRIDLPPDAGLCSPSASRSIELSLPDLDLCLSVLSFRCFFPDARKEDPKQKGKRSRATRADHPSLVAFFYLNLFRAPAAPKYFETEDLLRESGRRDAFIFCGRARKGEVALFRRQTSSKPNRPSLLLLQSHTTPPFHPFPLLETSLHSLDWRLGWRSLSLRRITMEERICRGVSAVQVSPSPSLPRSFLREMVLEELRISVGR